MTKIATLQLLPNFMKDKQSPREKLLKDKFPKERSPREKLSIEKTSKEKLGLDKVVLEKFSLNFDQKLNNTFEIINILHYLKGSINISMSPGKKDNIWDRDLLKDLKVIKGKKINVIVCLLEWGEMQKLDIYDYPYFAQKEGILFYHFPIKDRGIPEPKSLETLVPFLVKHVKNGYNILVHCRCGLGRSGLVAACCLSHFGYKFDDSISRVRNLRKGAIQTEDQLQIVRNYYRNKN